MSAIDVSEIILDPMQRMYLPPRMNMEPGEQAAALREYTDALQHADREDLHTAWRTVRNAHTRQSWPLPSALLKAVSDARKDRLGDKGSVSSKKQEQDRKDWANWQRARSNNIGRQAVSLSVAWSLKCAILNDHKDPSAIDLRDLRRQKDSAEALAARLDAGEIFPREHTGEGSYDDTAKKMWRTLLIREAETQAEINQHQGERVAA